MTGPYHAAPPGAVDAATLAPRTNPVFTGTVSVPAGSATSPSVSPSGDTDTGLSFPAPNTLTLGTGGVEAARFTPMQILVMGAPAAGAQQFQSGITPRVQAIGTSINDAGIGIARYSTANGGALVFARSRGAVGTHAMVQNGDACALISVGGSDGTGFQQASILRAEIDGAAISSTSMPGRWVFLTTPTGSVNSVERLRIAQDGAVTHREHATTVIDTQSHLGLRSYTVATLPSAAAAARLIYVADGSAGRRLAVSDGSTWRFPDGSPAA